MPLHIIKNIKFSKICLIFATSSTCGEPLTMLSGCRMNTVRYWYESVTNAVTAKPFLASTDGGSDDPFVMIGIMLLLAFTAPMAWEKSSLVSGEKENKNEKKGAKRGVFTHGSQQYHSSLLYFSLIT